MLVPFTFLETSQGDQLRRTICPRNHPEGKTGIYQLIVVCRRLNVFVGGLGGNSCTCAFEKLPAPRRRKA